jgi:hypothetical protein
MAKSVHPYSEHLLCHDTNQSQGDNLYSLAIVDINENTKLRKRGKKKKRRQRSLFEYIQLYVLGDQAWSRDRESRDRGDRPNHVTKLWSGSSHFTPKITFFTYF